MSNIEAWQYILALLTPYLVGLINRPDWTADRKRIVMIAVAVVIAIVSGFLEGAFSPFNLGQLSSYVVFMIAGTQVAYTALSKWDATKAVLDKAEVVGSGTTTTEAIMQKAEVKDEEVRSFEESLAS